MCWPVSQCCIQPHKPKHRQTDEQCVAGRSTVRMRNTYGERYAFHATDGETPVASVTGAAQYLMAVHVVCRLNYGHDRLRGSDTGNASDFARPNVTSLSHRERYRPSAWPCKRVEKKGEKDDTRTSKIAEKINYNNSNNSATNVHRPIHSLILYTRPLINIR